MSPPWTLLFVAAVALTACSGDGDGTASATVPPPATPAPAAAETPSTVAKEVETALADVGREWSVSIDVVAEGFGDDGIDATAEWTGDPEAAVEDGPFGPFGSCSGLRERVAAYSVFVSGASSADSVGVWTAERVTGPGVFDAEVRVERAGAAPLTASGTITILDGLQRGEFVAFGAGGGRIEGTFTCSGADPVTPLPTTDDGEGAAGSVEVVALLRDGDAERVVGLAADASSAADCPAVTGDAGDVLLRVGNGAGLGAITAIELAGPPTGIARLRVAGADYEFSDVTVSLDDTGTAGVFSAANVDGTSVDGAFRCT
jgi:hypothetical protein